MNFNKLNLLLGYFQLLAGLVGPLFINTLTPFVGVLHVIGLMQGMFLIIISFTLPLITLNSTNKRLLFYSLWLSCIVNFLGVVLTAVTGDTGASYGPIFDKYKNKTQNMFINIIVSILLNLSIYVILPICIIMCALIFGKSLNQGYLTATSIILFIILTKKGYDAFKQSLVALGKEKKKGDRKWKSCPFIHL